MLPLFRTLDMVVGATLREEHLAHFEATVARLRAGLRGAATRPITVHAGVVEIGVTMAAAAATFVDPGGTLHLALPVYVGDRIVDWSLALECSDTPGFTVELRRFAMGAPTYEVLHTQTSRPARTGARWPCKADGLAPVTVAAGWIYRLVLIGTTAGDKCYGGEVTLDHPRAG